jgi:hypothetical protein
MRTLEEELRGDNKAIVLIDERRARKALRTVNANLDLVTTRAFFKVLATDYGLNDTAAYWRLVLQVVENMDNVDEIEQVRFQLGAG